jgi:glycosyltransferase involved in cell wall biosynthesis
MADVPPRSPHVQVLLSTYNGERFLRPQLDSLLAQDHPNVSILVRDDGSSDGTQAILDEYARGGARMQVIRGTHLGFTQSFFDLIERSSPEADFLALSDQDDVWLPEKLSRAVRWLECHGADGPSLYGSAVMRVDHDLRPRGVLGARERRLSFRNALVTGPLGGCTMVFNRRAGELLRGRVPREAHFHDGWIYLVLSALGMVLFDPRPSILKRQHDRNAGGVYWGARNWVKLRTRSFISVGGSRPMIRQARAFERLYGERLTEEQRCILRRFLDAGRSVRSRLAYAARPDVYRDPLREDVIMRGLIVLNRL